MGGQRGADSGQRAKRRLHVPKFKLQLPLISCVTDLLLDFRFRLPPHMENGVTTTFLGSCLNETMTKVLSLMPDA